MGTSESSRVMVCRGEGKVHVLDPMREGHTLCGTFVGFTMRPGRLDESGASDGWRSQVVSGRELQILSSHRLVLFCAWCERTKDAGSVVGARP